MNTVLQNMCMIYDRENDKILVLDKVKKHGWEGLTFVGGHVEEGEVLYDSCVREVFEETGLTVKNLKLKGTVSWIDEIKDKRELGFLYYTEDFSGELIENNVEGTLSWFGIDEFRNANGKSYSIDKILDLFLNDDYSELIVKWNKNDEVETEEFF
ncbi:8-oxo-dGTP diphosphatase [Parvimonas parva]|uniref:8-oxo-dGTP diphosphatase n=1 Tax=Parvimonas parva TaxID=2769485 RepID=A0ABS1C915_9FIRM|nr:8-oxo-dGTP diphosphatase [Parvimonas parva]MBK1468599.1 8-oxo-dGTP diphosphatase [Parvimonas parva]